MNAIVGLVVVVVCVVGGYAAMGGNLLVLWQPWELVIVVGGTIGAYVIANPRTVLADTGRALGSLFRGRPYSKADYLDLLAMVYTVLRTGRSKGFNELEKDFDAPADSGFFQRYPTVHRNRRALQFACDYLRLIQLGTRNPHELESLMDEEIETLSRELSKTPRALQAASDSLPALGIVAAIMGMVKAMGAINSSPEVLGHMVGGALVGTFSGILLAYCLVGPVASSIAAQREAEVSYFICIRSALLAYLHGYQPQICVEYARKVLTSDIRPSFFEVEDATRSPVREAA